MKESSELLSTMDIVECLSFACRDVKHACDAGNNCPLMKKLRSLLLDVSDLRDRSFRVRLRIFTEECSVLERC